MWLVGDCRYSDNSVANRMAGAGVSLRRFISPFGERNSTPERRRREGPRLKRGLLSAQRAYNTMKMMIMLLLMHFRRQNQSLRVRTGEFALCGCVRGLSVAFRSKTFFFATNCSFRHFRHSSQQLPMRSRPFRCFSIKNVFFATNCSFRHFRHSSQ